MSDILRAMDRHYSDLMIISKIAKRVLSQAPNEIQRCDLGLSYRRGTTNNLYTDFFYIHYTNKNYTKP